MWENLHLLLQLTENGSKDENVVFAFLMSVAASTRCPLVIIVCAEYLTNGIQQCPMSQNMGMGLTSSN